MFPQFAIIDRGPDGTWSYLVQHFYSRQEAERVLPLIAAMHPRSRLEVIGPSK